MQYSQEALAEMASHVNLYDYAKQSVDFRKHINGIHYCECIFHHEKTPSLAFYEGQNRYYCFGCGAKGNIYNWLMKTEGLSFGKAVEKVASMTGTDPKNYVESESMSIYKELSRLSDNNYKKEDATEVRTILDFDKDYLQKFEKLYPQEWIDEGITKEAMDYYEVMVDEASNRIVYPVYDNDLNLIGVKGRTRYENFKELHLAKYMNYNKLGRIDYFAGIKQAEPYIKKSREVIVFEGIKSCMKCNVWGYKNTVAAETCEINPEQFNLLLRKGIATIVIAFDKGVTFGKIRKMCETYKSYFNIWVIMDTHSLLDDKMSPVDAGKDVWDQLYSQKIRI